MPGVLFVCLGNICRSPMAEAVFKDLVVKAGCANHIKVDSAGVAAEWNEPPHHGTQKVLKKRGIACDWIISRQFEKRDVTQWDYIICMDENNVRGVLRIGGKEHASKVHRMLDFAPHRQERDVEDPWYTGRFEYVYELIDESCKALLDKVCEDHGIEKRT
eukprot:TRINITY_DN1736_c0_g1_i1.p1 TRINITY_DN1736_c0_g1~~TRINITY_DN1736_c0_g1_i1.p1  ORF type:complete len:177 (-),score=41.23 TRINITY_DN1736_c0_g1_i1:115-594(-)